MSARRIHEWFSSPNNPEHELPLATLAPFRDVCCSRSALPKQGIDIVNMRVLDADQAFEAITQQQSIMDFEKVSQ